MTPMVGKEKKMIVNTQKLVTDIVSYESGEMSDEDTVSFFQELVNTGLVWNLQGHYGRMAVNLIESGLVIVPDAEEE